MRRLLAGAVLLAALPAPGLALDSEWIWPEPGIGYAPSTLFRFEPGGQVGVLTNIPDFFEYTPLHGFALDCGAQAAYFAFTPTSEGNQLFFTPPDFTAAVEPDLAGKLAALFPILCPLRASLRPVTMPTDENYPYLLDLRANPPMWTPLLQ